ncbi:MAG: hypothetical protein ACREEC_03010 [Thermoplasmata archaeon]
MMSLVLAAMDIYPAGGAFRRLLQITPVAVARAATTTADTP